RDGHDPADARPGAGCRHRLEAAPEVQEPGGARDSLDRAAPLGREAARGQLHRREREGAPDEDGRGLPEAPRLERRREPRGDRNAEGLGPLRGVYGAAGGAGLLQAEQADHASPGASKPHDPPPRPALRLSPLERRPSTLRLRAHRRRRDLALGFRLPAFSFVKLRGVRISADLIIPAAGTGELAEITSWDGVRTATFAVSEFPVDVVRFDGSSSPPVVLSRAKRAESLKALPGSLRTRAQEAFERAGRRPEKLALGHGRSLDLAQPPAIMGILNVTPDSFSDGGLYSDAGRAVERALQMFADGAAIVDAGGESTRPASYGEAAEVSAQEELRRVIPVLEGIRVRSELPLSIDTRKAAVAREALAAGADLVNDVTALRYDTEMADTVAR